MANYLKIPIDVLIWEEVKKEKEAFNEKRLEIQIEKFEHPPTDEPREKEKKDSVIIIQM